MYDTKEAAEMMKLLYQLRQCGDRGREKRQEIDFIIQGAAFVAAEAGAGRG